MTELISVIIPVYNQERYLDKSISGILDQTYMDLEIIAVNDGSTDSSLEILERYAHNDSRIRIINKENGGLIDAVAQGIVNSNGKYIAFMDPDDYVGRGYISDLYDLVDRDCDIVTAGMYACEIGERYSSNREIFLDEDKKYNCDEIINSFFWNRERACTILPIFQSRCGKLYERQVVISFVEEYRKNKDAVIGEDTIFNYLALLNSRMIKARRKPVEYFYCLRTESSMTRSVNYEGNYQKCKKTFSAFKAILEEKGAQVEQACELFYMQMQGLLYQSSHQKKEYIKIQKYLRNDDDYKLSYRIIICNAKGLAKINLMRKQINELILPIWVALYFRRIRNMLGIIRNRIGGIFR